jgi:hypothetical protein
MDQAFIFASPLDPKQMTPLELARVSLQQSGSQVGTLQRSNGQS